MRRSGNIKKQFCLCLFAQAVLFVLTPIVGMMITSMIIGSLEQGIFIWDLVVRTLAVFAGYGVLNIIKGYLQAHNDGLYIEARTEFFIMEWIAKSFTLSMEQYEDVKIRKLMEKSNKCIWTNDWGIEGFLRHNLELVESLLGLLVYAC